MNEDRLTELAKGLIERTEQGKAEWKPISDADTTAFRCDLQSGFVIIRSRDKDNNQPYLFLVYPREGGAPLEVLETKLGRPTVWNPLLDELFSVARNQALGISERLDNLLEEVGVRPPKGDDIPF